MISHRFVYCLFSVFRSKKLLEYACFHKADLEEADRDKGKGKDGAGEGSHRHGYGHSHGDGHGGKGASEFDAYSHKVISDV